MNETKIDDNKHVGMIINADDFGRNQMINLAIIELLRTNRIHRTTIMVNMPCAEEALNLVRNNDMLDRVGLHLNLTSGYPLSKPILTTRFCNNGEFDSSQVMNRVRLCLTKKEREAILCEVQAQFDKYKMLFGHYPKHVDSHRHVHGKFWFLSLIVKIAKKCGVESMRIGVNIYGKKKVGFMRKVYKFAINNYIKHFFETTDYIGSWWNYSECPGITVGKTVEIMVHPIVKEGKIMDIVCIGDKEFFYDFDEIR